LNNLHTNITSKICFGQWLIKRIKNRNPGHPCIAFKILFWYYIGNRKEVSALHRAVLRMHAMREEENNDGENI